MWGDANKHKYILYTLNRLFNVSIVFQKIIQKNFFRDLTKVLSIIMFLFLFRDITLSILLNCTAVLIKCFAQVIILPKLLFCSNFYFALYIKNIITFGKEAVTCTKMVRWKKIWKQHLADRILFFRNIPELRETIEEYRLVCSLRLFVNYYYLY